MQRDIQHAAVLAHKHAGRAFHRLGHTAVLVEETDVAVALGENDAAVGQEGHAPRLIEALGQGLGLEACFLALEHFAVDVRHRTDPAVYDVAADAQQSWHLGDLIGKEQSLEAVIGRIGQPIGQYLHQLGVGAAAEEIGGEQSARAGPGLVGRAMTGRAGGVVDLIRPRLQQSGHRGLLLACGNAQFGGPRRLGVLLYAGLRQGGARENLRQDHSRGGQQDTFHENFPVG